MSKRKIVIGGGVVLVLLFGCFYAFNSYIYNEKQGEPVTNYKEVTFWVSGEPVTLVDGVAQAYTDLGGESITTIRYFGNEAYQDLDGDGDEDVVFLITQETGGSGTFFYLVGALKEDDGYIGTHAVYIGDRIAPQTTNKGEGREVVVNYADRAPTEPFSTQPSIGKSLYLLLDPQTLEFGEVLKDFEGESR